MSAPTDFKSLINLFIDLITTAMPVLSGVALLIFFWGLATFIRNSGDAGKHQEGKDLMIWGVIAFFVLFALWGIIIFAQNSFGFTRPFGLPILPTR
jgi:hypothetical protein